MQRVLLVTTEDDLAADLVILHLGRRGVPFVRFNQEHFPDRIAITWPGHGRRGTLVVGGETVPSTEICSAWFRHPAGPPLTGLDERRTIVDFAARESTGFLAGFWETTPWFWMNRPSAVALASSKLRQLEQASELGFHVPETLITNCPNAARAFLHSRNGIAKTVVSGGIHDAGQQYAIYTRPVTCNDLSDEAVRAAPAIFQERITNGFDLRVTVVGKQVFATRISVGNHDGEVDWHAVDPTQLTYELHSLPSALEAGCVALATAFSLNFAALDFIVTPEGKHVFLELNPSGQWGWLESATGALITDAIVNQLIEGAR